MGSVAPMFGQEGWYIMLEIKSSVFKKSPINVDSFVLSAISDDATVNAKQVYGTDGSLRRFKTLTGVLPNGNLIGIITTYRNNGNEFEEIRELEFVVTPERNCEFVGYSPAKAHRVINPRELNYIEAACLDFGFKVPYIHRFSMYDHDYKLISLEKIFE